MESISLKYFQKSFRVFSIAGLWCLLIFPFMLFGKNIDELNAPINLRCEYKTDPLGIDIINPRFSWFVNDDRRGAVQSAYQLLVSSNEMLLNKNEGDIWDSGKRLTDQSIQVVYNGKNLESKKRYYWKVRTWDANGKVFPYSKIAFWEMGILNKDEWKAHWISVPEDKVKGNAIKFGKWIWHPTDERNDIPIYFQKSFRIKKNIEFSGAQVKITVDDKFVLYLNGKKVGADDQWRDISYYDVKEFLKKGENLISIVAENINGDRGLVLGMEITYTDGTVDNIVSDKAWYCNTDVSKSWMSTYEKSSDWVHPKIITEYGGINWGYIEYRKPAKSYYFRKEFELAENVKKGRIYITGLGLYKLWINGNVVGNDVLTPGWTRFPTRVQYQIYDITDFLVKGKNAIGVTLGNGWWSSVMAGNWRDGQPRLICQLEAELQNGKTKKVISDNKWRLHQSPILENSLFDGETYDARLEMPDWNMPNFDDGKWKQSVLADNKSTGKLVAQASATMQRIEELKPIAVSNPKQGITVYDFGQNHAGRIKLKVRGKAGTRIQIRHSEILNPDGTLYTDNYRMAKATDVYILQGDGEEKYEPTFTYRGFRYAEISGYPGKLFKGEVVSQVIHNNVEAIGKFKCSNELINQINKNIVWGQRSNMYSVPTDCPQRNERLGWTGDAQVFAPTSCWNMDMAMFYTKWMHDIIDSQNPEGIVQNINPTLENKISSPGWGDAVIVIPWTIYQFYGDTRIIEENYEGMKKWIDYMRSQATDDLLYLQAGYGDWLSTEKSPVKPIASAYYYNSTKLFAKMALVIGKTNDAEEYSKLAKEIAVAFDKTYLSEEFTYPANTQTANVLPLGFGIVPQKNKDKIVSNLVSDIEDKDYHLSTGFLGTAQLFKALSNNNKHDIAYKIAMQKTFPSWGYTIANGATTIWEHWDSNRIEEVDASMNSYNHFALGTVGEWFYQSLAGINIDPEYPSFKRIIIRPRPVGDLTWAEAEFISVYGEIFSRWEIKENDLSLNITIPANTTAIVYLPVDNKDDMTIYESGKKCFYNGNLTGVIAGMNFIKSTESEIIYKIKAGSYKFKIRNVIK